MNGIPPTVENQACSEEARMRAFAVQLLYLMRTYSVQAAPPVIWAAVKTLELALRAEPFPPSGSWEDSALMNAWKGVSKAQSSVRASQWRSASERISASAVEAAVGKVMNAVTDAHSADRYFSEAASAETGHAKNWRSEDAEHKLIDVTQHASQACLIASEIGVPTAYLQPFRALLLPDSDVVPGRILWERQARTLSDSERMRNFAFATIKAMMAAPLTTMPQTMVDELQDALFEDDDALTAAIDRVTAGVTAAEQSRPDLNWDGTNTVQLKRTVRVAIEAMLDARRADAFRKHATEADEPGERQRLEKEADAALAMAHLKGRAVCVEAEAARVKALDLAYMRYRLPVEDKGGTN